MLAATTPRPIPTAPGRRPAIALAADNRQKARLVDVAISYRDVLVRHQLFATATTGRMLTDMAGLRVDCLRPGMAGGDRQVAAALVGRGGAAVIFLVDPFSDGLCDPALEPLLRACSLHDIPLATNIATASAVLHAIAAAEFMATGPPLREK